MPRRHTAGTDRLQIPAKFLMAPLAEGSERNRGNRLYARAEEWIFAVAAVSSTREL
jgi:hypothetical protein